MNLKIYSATVQNTITTIIKFIIIYGSIKSVINYLNLELYLSVTNYINVCDVLQITEYFISILTF